MDDDSSSEESERSSDSEDSSIDVVNVDAVNADVRRYRSRTFAQKKEVVQYAAQTSIKAASERFKVDRKSIREWKKIDFGVIENPSKRKRKYGGGSKRKCVELEDRLWHWIRQKRDAKLRVSRAMVMAESRQIFTELLNEGTATDNNFKFSYGWFRNFMGRYKLSFRRKTTVCSKDPKDLVPKMVSHMIYNRKYRAQHNIGLSQIYGGDETAVSFDSSGEITIESKGVKEVSIMTTGHDKARITVLLCAKADGTKCKPFVLLPRKRPMKELEKFSSGLIISYAGKVWMDDELTEEFLRKAIGQDLFGRKRLLVWDSFRPHYSEKTKVVLRDLKLDISIIPGGTTKYIQPADVSWNSPFKAKIKELYAQWMSNGKPKEKTTGGNVKAPSCELLCQWVSTAWKEISSDDVKKSFRSCGISNNLDGSEDNQISCFKQGRSCYGGLELLTAELNKLEEEGVQLAEDMEFAVVSSDSESELEY